MKKNNQKEKLATTATCNRFSIS